MMSYKFKMEKLTKQTLVTSNPCRRQFYYRVRNYLVISFIRMVAMGKVSTANIDLSLPGALITNYNMTAMILAGNEINFAIAAGLIRSHMPGGQYSFV